MFKYYFSKYFSIIKSIIFFLLSISGIVISFIAFIPRKLVINPARKYILIGFAIIYIVRLVVHFFEFENNRKKPDWINTLIYMYFSGLIGYVIVISSIGCEITIGLIDYLGIALYLLGSYLNTRAEYEKYEYRRSQGDESGLFLGGLFRYSRNIDHFGTFIIYLGWAIPTRNIYAMAIPLNAAIIYIFGIIPQKDKRLIKKYGRIYKEYARKTKKFIPFIY